MLFRSTNRRINNLCEYIVTSIKDVQASAAFQSIRLPNVSVLVVRERADARKNQPVECPSSAQVDLAHPAIGILSRRGVFADLEFVVVFDRVLQEFEAVSEDLGLHPPVRAV